MFKNSGVRRYFLKQKLGATGFTETRLLFEENFPCNKHWVSWSEEKLAYDCFIGQADSDCREYNRMFDVWVCQEILKVED